MSVSLVQADAYICCMKRKYLMLFFMLCWGILHGQQNILTAGFQYKPLFGNRFFDSGSISLKGKAVSVLFEPRPAYSFGMIVRRGISQRFSFETGINITARKYRMTITDTSFAGRSVFSINSYDVPFTGLVFIRLGEKLYMNSSLGTTLDIFPSDVATSDYYFRHYARRRSMLQTALTANLGYEYRTEKSGYFYVGASYHKPFRSIYASSVEYDGKIKEELLAILPGSYLTLDFRYFFYTDSLRKKENKK